MRDVSLQDNRGWQKEQRTSRGTLRRWIRMAATLTAVGLIAACGAAGDETGEGEENIGAAEQALLQCDNLCPAGMYAAERRCDPSCAGTCYGGVTNAVVCEPIPDSGSFTQCNTECPFGWHIESYACDTGTCGGTLCTGGANKSTCVRNGQSFTQCGLACPPNYVRDSMFPSAACGSWLYDNAAQCTSHMCDNVNCDDGNPCTTDACDWGTGDCTHTPAPAGTVCGAASGDCDKAETCNGTSTTCPADGVQAAGYTCRAASGLCDKAEACDGSSKACPADLIQPAGYACHPSAGICDPAEFCNGTSKACPTNAYSPAGTPCRGSANACDPAESCTGASPYCPSDVPVINCDDGNPCTADSCDGNGGCLHTPLAAGTACTDDGNACTTDACDGNGACAHGPAPAGTACASDGKACTKDVCDGNGVCSHDTPAPAGTLCRLGFDDCNPDEYCNGTSLSCPADVDNCLCESKPWMCE